MIYLQISLTIAVLACAAGWLGSKFASPFPNIHTWGDWVAGLGYLISVAAVIVSALLWIWVV